MSADILGFPFKTALDGAYQQFVSVMSSDNSKFFHESLSGKVDRSSSITSFLCTDIAFNIYEAAKQLFDSYTPTYPHTDLNGATAVRKGAFERRSAADRAGISKSCSQ